MFATYWFVLFALAVLAAWTGVRAPTGRLAMLLAGSLVFHRHFAGAAGMIPIAVLALTTYLLARTRHLAACTTGIVIAAAALCFYKYGRFVALDVLAPVSVPLSVRR